MGEPKKTLDERRTTINFAAPGLLRDRLDALAETGDRSALIRSLIEQGMETRYGPHWDEYADLLIAKKQEAKVA